MKKMPLPNIDDIFSNVKIIDIPKEMKNLEAYDYFIEQVDPQDQKVIDVLFKIRGLYKQFPKLPLPEIAEMLCSSNMNASNMKQIFDKDEKCVKLWGKDDHIFIRITQGEKVLFAEDLTES